MKDMIILHRTNFRTCYFIDLNRVFLLPEKQVERIRPFFPLSYEVPCLDERQVPSGLYM